MGLSDISFSHCTVLVDLSHFSLGKMLQQENLNLLCVQQSWEFSSHITHMEQPPPPKKKPHRAWGTIVLGNFCSLV